MGTLRNLAGRARAASSGRRPSLKHATRAAPAAETD